MLLLLVVVVDDHDVVVGSWLLPCNLSGLYLNCWLRVQMLLHVYYVLFDDGRCCVIAISEF